MNYIQKQPLLGALLLLAGIATAHAGEIPVTSTPCPGLATPSGLNELEKTSLPPKRRFSLRQKLNPFWWFKNADDPVPPAWYQPKNKFRNLTWNLRNSGHNFTHYVIGVTDHWDSPDFKRTGKYPQAVFSSKPGWNYAMIKYHGVVLPFVSYWDRHVRFYVGWRQSGNLGAKLIKGTKENP